MKIHVTEEDIKNGVRDSCGGCPIALAIARQCGGYVHAGMFAVRIGQACWVTPGAALDFMSRFDAGKPVEPFSFELAASPDYTTVTP